MPTVSGRRAKGEGTWETLPSGKVRLIVQFKNQKVKGPAAESKTLARQLLKQKLADLANPNAPLKGKSFGTRASEWLSSKRYSPTTNEVYGYWVSSIAKDPLGKMLPDQIREKDLESWKARQTLAKSTLRNRCAWINQLLKFCQVEVRISVPRKSKHNRRPLFPEEIQAAGTLLTQLDEDTRIFALLCFVCGLRRSEACGLQHDDRIGDGFIPKRSAVIVKRKIILRKILKTDESEAWVPIPPMLDKEIGGKPGYVVGGTRGPLSGKMLYDRLKKAAKGTPLEKVPYFGLHALRRTYGFMQLEAGADVVTVASNMRHDPKMLLDEYSRTRRDLKTKSVAGVFDGLTPTEQPTI